MLIVLILIYWYWYGVPQGSILGPLRNIDICDLCYNHKWLCDIASYADNNTPHTSDINLKLESSTYDLF